MTTKTYLDVGGPQGHDPLDYRAWGSGSGRGGYMMSANGYGEGSGATAGNGGSMWTRRVYMLLGDAVVFAERRTGPRSGISRYR